MGHLYAYAPTESNCSTAGLVGALLVTSATFELNAGEFGELSFEHPKDGFGKWKAIKNGVIIRCPVPVAYCPDFNDSGAYVSTVETWSLLSTSADADRKVFNKAKDGKAVATVPAGTPVTIVGVDLSNDMRKIKASWTYKKGRKTKSKTVSGWISTSVLDSKISESTVTPGHSGTESVATSYMVRDQLFRVYNVTVSDSDGGNISVSARRLVYDLLGNLSTYSNSSADGVSCKTVCGGVLTNTVEPHDFTSHSDVADTRVGFDARDQNPITAICDSETGVVSRWDCEVTVDDYDLYVLHRVGVDRGVHILYKKNLTGLSVEEDTSEVTVGIRPKGTKADGYPLYLDNDASKDSTRTKYCWNAKTSTYERTLPSGYIFGTGKASTVIYRKDESGNAITDTYSVSKVASLEVSDATVSKDLSTNLAMYRMVTQAVSSFDSGCDEVTLSMSVDFQTLDNSEEAKQYRRLENLFVYDRVHVAHRPLGISADLDLMSLSWDVLAECPTSAEFGSLRDASVSIASWQINSVSGAKLIDGTVGGSAMADGAVSTRHIQAESINADAIQANAITSEKIYAGAITTEKLDADAVTSQKIKAGSVTADKLDATTVNAKIAELVQANIGSANIDFAQIKYLDAATAVIKQLIAQDAVTKKYYIEELQVDNAQIVNATVANLVIKASDGKYYKLDVAANGSISPVEVAPTDAQKAAGQMGTGSIIETDLTVEDLGATNLKAINALIDKLTAARLDVDELFARQATINKLITTDISSNTYIRQSINSAVGAFARLDDDGLHVGQRSSTSEVLIDNDSVDVKLNGVAYSQLGADYVQFGNYQLRKSADGGLVFKMSE